MAWYLSAYAKQYNISKLKHGREEKPVPFSTHFIITSDNTASSINGLIPFVQGKLSSTWILIIAKNIHTL